MVEQPHDFDSSMPEDNAAANGQGNAATPITDQTQADERERLLKSRRQRQMGGGTRQNGRQLLVISLFILAGILALLAAIGPSQAFKYFGFGARPEPKVSQVDLEVARVTDNNRPLDFTVPAPAAVPDKPNADAALNKRFDELRKQIDAVARLNKGSDVSLSDVKSLLERYNQEMAAKLQEERQRSDAENARLRAEALSAQEERKRLEDAAKLNAAKRKELQDINKKQLESAGVIVDESGANLAASPEAGGSGEAGDNQRFLANNAGSEVKTSLSRTLSDPSRTIVQGTIISAVLETAINTELPGNIRAQVIEPVFSFDGARVLMPAGTTLIGAFNDKIDIEQKRILIAWNRAVTPEGKSIALGSVGTDLLGRSGTGANVDNRYGKKIGAAVLLSAITSLPSILPSLTGNRRSSDNGTTINIGNSGGGGNVGSQAAASLAGEASSQGKGILDKYLSLPPILRVPQGEELRVFVNRDLIIR